MNFPAAEADMKHGEHVRQPPPPQKKRKDKLKMNAGQQY